MWNDLKMPLNSLFCKLHINQIFQFLGWYFVYNTNINYFCNLSTNNYDDIWTIKNLIWNKYWVWNDRTTVGVKRPAPGHFSERSSGCSNENRHVQLNITSSILKIGHCYFHQEVTLIEIFDSLNFRQIYWVWTEIYANESWCFWQSCEWNSIGVCDQVQTPART